MGTKVVVDLVAAFILSPIKCNCLLSLFHFPMAFCSHAFSSLILRNVQQKLECYLASFFFIVCCFLDMESIVTLEFCRIVDYGKPTLVAIVGIILYF